MVERRCVLQIAVEHKWTNHQGEQLSSERRVYGVNGKVADELLAHCRNKARWVNQILVRTKVFVLAAAMGIG